MRFSDDLQREIYYRSQIDYCYWMLEEISTQPQSKETKETSIEMLKCIIKQKPKLGYDVIKDKETLKKVRAIKL